MSENLLKALLELFAIIAKEGTVKWRDTWASGRES